MVVMLISLALAATALVGSAGVAGAQTPDYYLEIRAPDYVTVGQAFTVRVLITDDGLVTEGCASRVPVTLRAVTEGPTREYTARARAGIARFRATLPEAGFWNLTADVLDGTCEAIFQRASHQLTALPRGLSIPPCPPGMTCEQTWNHSYTAARLTAPAGTFTTAWDDYDSSLDCGKEPLDPNNGVLVFDLDDDQVSKKIIFALAPQIVKKGIGRLRVCWNSGDGARWLPPCKKGDLGPCVLFKRSTKHNAALVGVLAPPGDPRGYAR
jgi:hypothetical protein